MTKLEILNHLLAVVGETPVSNPDSNHPTAISARVFIDKVDKQVQRRGWWFNEDKKLPLVANSIGEVVIPSNTEKVKPSSIRDRFVRRGTRLYDPINHTFTLNRTVEVDIILRLDLEDLPETAAAAISAQAAYEFYMNDDGDAQKSSELKMLWGIAKVELLQEELSARRSNALMRPVAQRLRMGIQRYGNGLSNPNLPGGR